MDSVAERVSGWWVARVSPQRVTKFAQNLADEHYIPLTVKKKPFIPYVFIRAQGQSSAWQLAGFQSWLLLGQTRAIVPDRELDEFRRVIDLMHEQNKQTVCRRGLRLIRKFSGNQDFVEKHA